jgi:hypothetical protein
VVLRTAFGGCLLFLIVVTLRVFERQESHNAASDRQEGVSEPTRPEPLEHDDAASGRPSKARTNTVSASDAPLLMRSQEPQSLNVAQDEIGLAIDPGGIQVCSSDEDCVGGLCLYERERSRFRCKKSDCTSLEDCPSGMRCVLAESQTGSSRRIGVCLQIAQVRLGGSCKELSSLASLRCAEGVCYGGVCTSECTQASDCKEGQKCFRRASASIGLCVKDCTPGECAQDEECADIGGWTRCLKTSGTNCFLHPCDAGFSCENSGKPGEAVFYCAKLCSPISGGCAEGEFCGAGNELGRSVCYKQRCTNLIKCPQGMTCVNAKH